MSSRILVDVPAKELNERAQAQLDPTRARDPDCRFFVRRTRLVWVPAACLAGLLVVGAVAVRATVQAGLDRSQGDQRFVYGSMAAICLVFALFAAQRLVLGWAERRQLRNGMFRQGMHVIGREGLLIAGRRRHTWVPRELLPEPVKVASTGRNGAAYTFTLVDQASGRRTVLRCGFVRQSALWAWQHHGVLPNSTE